MSAGRKTFLQGLQDKYVPKKDVPKKDAHKMGKIDSDSSSSSLENKKTKVISFEYIHYIY